MRTISEVLLLVESDWSSYNLETNTLDYMGDFGLVPLHEVEGHQHTLEYTIKGEERKIMINTLTGAVGWTGDEDDIALTTTPVTNDASKRVLNVWVMDPRAKAEFERMFAEFIFTA